MRWFTTKDLRSTISALFSVTTLGTAEEPDHVTLLENVRAQMLALLPPGTGPGLEALSRRIRFAVNGEALWYARGELMAQLARVHGELAAREKVETLSSTFERLLPRGLRPRPARPGAPGYRSSRPGAG
jgi:hypothetical protein